MTTITRLSIDDDICIKDYNNFIQNPPNIFSGLPSAKYNITLLGSKESKNIFDLEFINNQDEYLLSYQYMAGSGNTSNVNIYKMYKKKYNQHINRPLSVKSDSKIDRLLIPKTHNNYEFIKTVIIKFFKDEFDYKIEKQNVYKLKHIIKNIHKNETDYNKHYILFNDDINKCIIYNYLGRRIRNEYIVNLKLKQKVSLMIQLLEQCIKLNDYLFIQNDIKPENIVIDFDPDGEPNISIIDYGILYYIPEDFNEGNIFNTTIWSGSPEYLKIAKLIKDNEVLYNADIKDIFIKSQYYALAGLMIGLLVNDIYYYFNTVIQYVDVNEEHNMETRFMKYTEELIPLIMKDIINKLNEVKPEPSNTIPIFWKKTDMGLKKIVCDDYIFSTLKIIIYSMFDYNYKNRLSLNDVLTEVKKCHSQFS